MTMMEMNDRAMKRKKEVFEENDDAAVKVARLKEAAAVTGWPHNGAGSNAAQALDRAPATVVHEVAVPEGTIYSTKPQKPGATPAKEYPFVLDPFQVCGPTSC